MSGLIWAGIGKGISDAGAAIGANMFKSIDAQETEERNDKRLSAREALADERMREREGLIDTRLQEREIRAEERKRADEQRDATIYAEAEGAAPGIGDQRRFDKFKADLGPESALTEEQARGVFDRYYNQRQVGTDESANRYLERYSKQRADVITEIRKRGGSGGLITQAIAEQRAASEAEKAADRFALDTQRETRREREGRERAEADAKRLEAFVARANRPPAPVTDPSTRPATTADLQRQVTAAQNTLAIELGVPRNDINSGLAALKRRAERGDAAAKTRLDEIAPFVQELSDANRRMLDFKRPSPAAGDGQRTGGTNAPRDYSNLWK
jgi:hypothetical protein